MNSFEIGISVWYVLDVPAVSFKALADIFGEGDIGGTVDRDMVVVVEGD